MRRKSTNGCPASLHGNGYDWVGSPGNKGKGPPSKLVKHGVVRWIMVHPFRVQARPHAMRRRKNMDGDKRMR